MKFHRDIPVGIVLLIFSSIVLYFATGIKAEAAYVPEALAVFMIICALVITFNGIRATNTAQGDFQYKMKLSDSKNAFVFMLFIVVYYLVFRYVTYWIATPLFMIFAQKHLKVKSWKVNLLITIIYTVFCFVMFVMVLKLPIYRIGILGKYFRYV